MSQQISIANSDSELVVVYIVTSVAVSCASGNSWNSIQQNHANWCNKSWSNKDMALQCHEKLERELGDKRNDNSVWRRNHHIWMYKCRHQSHSRVHWWLYLHVNEKGCESTTKWRVVLQTDWWLDLKFTESSTAPHVQSRLQKGH